MQFGFMPGRSRVDIIFILRRIMNSFLESNRLFYCFAVLKKTYERVPKNFIQLA